jgi:hypothetical protein
MADAGTGAVGLIRVDAGRAGSSAAGNYSDVSWAFYLIENGPYYNSTFSNDPIGANVSLDGVGTVWSGSFTFSWGGAGYQTTLIASGTTRVYHAADGSGGTTVRGNMGATGTSGAGGPASVAQGVALPTLKVLPGTPSGVSASRISDTSVSLSWAQSSASNGQPTSNTIRRRINGSAFSDAVTISPARSASLSAAANEKLEYSVRAANAAGTTGWSATSGAIFTTPAAPTNVSAVKNVAGNILVSWAQNVAFLEHRNYMEHGTVLAGVTTWDGSPYTSVPAGDLSAVYVSPDPTKVHIFRVYAKNTDVGALESARAVSNTVQLAAAPNKPTLPALPAFVDKGKTFVIPWSHNPVDATAQTAYELAGSTDGGATWASGGKTTSTATSETLPSSSYPANEAVTIRVRTWGQATAGGSDGTGASPWSDQQTVTFKTRPAVTITSPVGGGTYTQSALAVGLGFSQAEAATFVSATIELFQGATLVESLLSTTRASTLMGTRVQDGVSYTVKVTVLDSNGLTSNQVTSAFSVAYTLPVAAGVTVTYLPDSGIAQLDLTIPDPSVGQSAATLVTILREIGGVTETVVDKYPRAATLTLLDTTPTINGTNLYTVTTISADGATSTTIVELVTDEPHWAFLSTGNGFANIIRFMGNLKFASTPSRTKKLIQTAGRKKRLALFGQSTTLEIAGSATLAEGLGSTPDEVEAFILEAGIVAYRDPSGRRMFGVLDGEIDSPSSITSTFSYSVSEAD